MTKKPSKKTTSGQTEKTAAETPKAVSPKTVSPKAEKPGGETRSTVRGAPMEVAPLPAASAHASVPRPAAAPMRDPAPAAKPSAPAPRRSEPAALAPTAKAAEPVPAQAPGPGPGPAHAPSAPTDWEARLAAMESRIARAADRLEAMLERPAAVVPPAALPASRTRKGKPAPEPAGSPAEPAADDLDEVTTSFRRALGEALDRKLEEVIAPTVALYHRLRDEARALDEEASGPAIADLKALIADATSDVEKILRLLGGGFIAPEPGEHYDPLIHLAVGEAPRPGGGAPEPSEGARSVASVASVASVVSEVVRPGYRSSRGRVVLPAKVTIERN